MTTAAMTTTSANEDEGSSMKDAGIFGRTVGLILGLISAIGVMPWVAPHFIKGVAEAVHLSSSNRSGPELLRKAD